ncbi:hypothetical protein K9F62_19630 [Desulfovibrio sp. JY]|nr:hypothetical protein K9F62_19630 [Desulfovibrio sp. JY]
MSKKIDATVRTRSMRGGHYRAGRKHEETVGDFPPGTFTEEQLAQLQADPDLKVEVLEAPRKKKQPAEGEEKSPEAPDTADEADEDFAFDEAAKAPEAKAK